MRRYIICLLAVLFCLALPAQEIPELISPYEFSINEFSIDEFSIDERPDSGLFPLALILEASGCTRAGYTRSSFAGDVSKSWMPDWPLELPPDAFRVNSGETRRIFIEGEGFSLNFRYGPDGLIEEFPFMLYNKMAQVSLVYRGPLIEEMFISFPYGEEESWLLEFLEYRDFFPSMVRAYMGGAWYFISLFRGGNEIMETWYNEEGEALGAYSYSLILIGGNSRIRTIRDYLSLEGITEYHYDSRGLITAISGPGGFYRVLYYREDLPRYWELSPTGNFSLQWDEQDTLLGIRGESEGGHVDYRYEYTFDEKGNWIERREIRLTPMGQVTPGMEGLLFPVPGTLFRRVIEYKE